MGCPGESNWAWRSQFFCEVWEGCGFLQSISILGCTFDGGHDDCLQQENLPEIIWEFMLNGLGMSQTAAAECRSFPNEESPTLSSYSRSASTFIAFAVLFAIVLPLVLACFWSVRCSSLLKARHIGSEKLLE